MKQFLGRVLGHTANGDVLYVEHDGTNLILTTETEGDDMENNRIVLSPATWATIKSLMASGENEATNTGARR